MANITITKTITQPEEVINAFADNLGYQAVVTNPEYTPAQYDAETMEIIVPAVGEPTKPNPQTRLQFVSEKFDDLVSDKFFGQFARRDAERLKAEEAKILAQQTVEAIKATIVTK